MLRVVSLTRQILHQSILRHTDISSAVPADVLAPPGTSVSSTECNLPHYASFKTLNTVAL